jgi:hypothetical protein
MISEPITKGYRGIENAPSNWNSFFLNRNHNIFTPEFLESTLICLYCMCVNWLRHTIPRSCCTVLPRTRIMEISWNWSLDVWMFAQMVRKKIRVTLVHTVFYASAKFIDTRWCACATDERLCWLPLSRNVTVYFRVRYGNVRRHWQTRECSLGSLRMTKCVLHSPPRSWRIIDAELGFHESLSRFSGCWIVSSTAWAHHLLSRTLALE